MAKYHDIQILRGTKDAIEANADYTLYDGQPLYDKTSNLLYVGDGSRPLEESVPVSTQSIQHTDGAEFKLVQGVGFVDSKANIHYDPYILTSTEGVKEVTVGGTTRKVEKIVEAKYADRAFDDHLGRNILQNYIRHNEQSIMTSDFIPGAVTESVLGTNSVTTAKINDLAVTANKIQDSAITSDKFASSAVCPTASVANDSLKINGLSITKDPTTGILKVDNNIIPYKVLLWEGSASSSSTGNSDGSIDVTRGSITLTSDKFTYDYYEIEYEFSTWKHTARIYKTGSYVTDYVYSSTGHVNLKPCYNKLRVETASFQYKFTSTKAMDFGPVYVNLMTAEYDFNTNQPVKMPEKVKVHDVTIKRIYALIG